jgi:hypothetical protein
MDIREKSHDSAALAALRIFLSAEAREVLSANIVFPSVTQGTVHVAS